MVEAVSIILKTWNAPRHIKLCIEYLLKNTTGEYELFIIDNGSRETVVEYLIAVAEVHPHIRLVQNERNLGPGYANRQGFQAAANSLVCLMDSDVLVPPGWLGRLVSDFTRTPGLKMLSPLKHEEGISYPFGTQLENSRQVWFETKRKHSNISPLQQFLKFSHGRSLEQFDRLIRGANPGEMEIIPSPPDFLGTSCVLMDGEFVKEIGGIADPQFRGYGSEDVDLCWRIGEAGGLVAKTRSVYVHHFHGSSLEDNRLDRSSALVMANQILYAKWKSRLLSLALDNAQPGESVLEDFLESHFIFHLLAHNTSFLHDLRRVLDEAGIHALVPDELIWRNPGDKFN